MPLGGSDDCDDSDPNSYLLSLVYLDEDGDGYTTTAEPFLVCWTEDLASGSFVETTLGLDCNDFNIEVWQSALLYIDNDNDGYDAGTQTVCYGASIPSGYSAGTLGGDCNDNNAAVNPGATEVCGNGIDDNCNEDVDEGCVTCTGPPATPVSISGPSLNVCKGSSESYSVAPVSGATGYFWTTTGDITLTSPQGNNPATFSFGSNFTTGSVRVQAYNECDTSTVRLLSM
jgi:hypothetical protein